MSPAACSSRAPSAPRAACQPSSASPDRPAPDGASRRPPRRGYGRARRVEVPTVRPLAVDADDVDHGKLHAVDDARAQPDSCTRLTACHLPVWRAKISSPGRSSETGLLGATPGEPSHGARASRGRSCGRCSRSRRCRGWGSRRSAPSRGSGRTSASRSRPYPSSRKPSSSASWSSSRHLLSKSLPRKRHDRAIIFRGDGGGLPSLAPRLT